MSQFKVIFPSGYTIQNVDNDNLDINVILPDGGVFFATFFTTLNIQELMKNGYPLYFWATDMVIIKDLKLETIKNAISKIIEDGYFEESFSKIGTIESIYPERKKYDEIIDNA